MAPKIMRKNKPKRYRECVDRYQEPLMICLEYISDAGEEEFP